MLMIQFLADIAITAQPGLATGAMTTPLLTTAQHGDTLLNCDIVCR
jgi:hypothetical protein